MGYSKKNYKTGAELKDIPAGNKGLTKLPKEVRNNMGYMKAGGEKLLNQMTYGGASMDMSDKLVNSMRYGGATTYSGPKKTKK